MYRLLASDMDETFIGRDYTVHPDNLRAIRDMEAAGCLFVVATGRPYSSVQDTLELIGHKGRADRYCITYNGGYVARCNGEILAGHPLDDDVADTLYRFGLEQGLCLHVYCEDGCYIAGITPAEDRYLEGRMDYKPCDGVLPSRIGPTVYKVLVHSTDMDELRRAESLLRERMPELVDGLEVTYSANRYLEFNPKGVSKGRALLELAQSLGVDPKDTVAVGDSTNDLSMLQDAGLGLCVANRSDEISRLIDADHTLSRTCDEGAIGEIWERYIRPSIEG